VVSHVTAWTGLKVSTLCRVFAKILYAPPREPPKEKDATMKAASKLRAFIKRSSEPLLNMQPQQVRQQVRRSGCGVAAFRAVVNVMLLQRFASSLSTIQEVTNLGLNIIHLGMLFTILMLQGQRNCVFEY
jgi:hypothetical protein